MEIKLYNTLTRDKEVFTPIVQNKVGIYTCGPTVYNYAHIGNLRTYIFMDILRRIFELNGYKVKSVMNITDVGHLLSDGDEGEDKLEMAAKEQKKTPQEIAEYYTSVFFADIKRLNIKRPHVTPKATDNIAEMEAIVSGLMDKGFAYETDDGIYFDISKYDGYGALSGNKLEDLKAGARVGINSQKRHPADFAIWKKAEKNHIMQWDSKWGMSYPGWHMECTAMSLKYLGDHFDIHTGGIDHVPIHHENEIAQTESYLGKKSVNYWMHSEFMLVNGGKMSKSLGNAYTVEELVQRGYSPMDFRYFCLNAQYRQKLNFTFEGMDSSKVAFERLKRSLLLHKASNEAAPSGVVESFRQKFFEAINDDLNVPMALGVLWQLLKQPHSKEIYDLAIFMDNVFGLGFESFKEEQVQAPNEVVALAAQRLQAKKARDFAEADRLRGEIEKAGYQVNDNASGYTLEKIK